MKIIREFLLNVGIQFFSICMIDTPDEEFKDYVIYLFP